MGRTDTAVRVILPLRPTPEERRSAQVRRSVASRVRACPPPRSSARPDALARVGCGRRAGRRAITWLRVGRPTCRSQPLGRVLVQDTTCHMSISLDGFVAGPEQSREDPLGKRGRELHRWHLGDERANEADETAAGWLMRPRGAYVMGRNMFGPIRGAWEEDWRGWWGPEPPYHAPVFVLTNHAREPIEMEGGTTFHFVTDGFDAALEQARAAAGDRGVDIAGGASTVRQALAAGAIDELVLDVAPVLLGAGERLFDGVESFGFEPVEVLHSPLATHIRYRVVGR